MLIFFAHAVDIVSHEVDRLAERIRASAKDLNGLPHELDIALRETLISSIFHLVRGCLRLTETAVCGSTFSTASIALLCSLLLFLSDSAHFDLRASVFVSSGLIVVIFALIHHGFGLLNKLTLAFILELRPLLKLLTIVVVLLGWLVILYVSITDQLLVALLLFHSSLLLLHCSHLGSLFILLTLALSFFLLDTLLFLLFSPSLCLLLFLAAGFLFGALALLFSFCSCSLFLSSLSLHLLTHGLFLILLGLGCAIIGCTAPAAENLLHVRCRVDASCGSAEHCLEEQIGLFWLMTRYNLGWLHVNLFANYELRKLDQLYKEINLGIFFSYTFRV